MTGKRMGPRGPQWQILARGTVPLRRLVPCGTPVRAADGARLGVVVACAPAFFLIETLPDGVGDSAWLRLPRSEVVQLGPGGIVLRSLAGWPRSVIDGGSSAP